jgi:glucokinase
MMFLGIEIGGTKLQLGVGLGNGPPLLALERRPVEPAHGAAAIRAQIVAAARPLIERYRIQALGFGFGGPVDTAAGRVVKSHQVTGWDDFPLADWCRENLGVPAVVANDADSAGLAEARFGGGRGRKVVFYTNVGSGIGGALVIDGHLYAGGSGVTAEIGHLRPGLTAQRGDQTVESLASGWAIAAAARRVLASETAQGTQSLGLTDLLEQCEGQPERLTTGLIAQAAAAGNPLAEQVFGDACRTFGWAVAQVITLVAPNVVVVGGGVSLAGEKVFFAPLRREVDRYVFPPLLGTFEIVPAALGEEVVVHGALALAAEQIL